MQPTQHQTGRTDVAIIGRGPAGLQAALTLGRIHRDAVLFDDGTYRNARAGRMHNVVANDGRPPAEFRAIARGELAAYDTIAVRDVRVTDVLEADGGFRLVLADDSVLFGSYGADLPYILPEGEDVPLDSGGWTAGGSGASAQRPPSIGLGTGGLY